MSRLQANEPECSRDGKKVKLIVRGKSKDLGGFSVSRVLPSAQVRRVGPFVFFDHMGPADFPPGKGINVRPHPHIGLATVTYLFEGEMVHRDSLGYVQTIRPGAVNLMTAGRGIVHSERTDPALERSGQRMNGLQIWMALPEDQQEIEPAFVHHPRESLPVIRQPGIVTTVVIGRYEGRESPVRVLPETLYLAQSWDEGASCRLDVDAEQLAVYVVSGGLNIEGVSIEAGVLAVLERGPVTLTAAEESRVAIIGGEDVGHREIDWNFVHTSRARIEAARADWRDMKFARVPGDDEFIPLPD